MKEFSAASAYSIETIQGNTIISKSGDLSVVYELIEPECYSLSEEDMQKRHEEYMRAFSHISYGYIHRQDIYLRDNFDGRDMPHGSFISDAESGWGLYAYFFFIVFGVDYELKNCVFS